MSNNKNTLTAFKNGASTRLHNKRISFKQDESSTVIAFQFADEDAEKPACGHTCHRGKVRHTVVKMSNDAMDALVNSYIHYKRGEYLKEKKDGEKQ